jgi:hypothetical protein
MARPLNSDELGGKGEKRLAELLLDARLKPNSPDRDRVGWDSVVTWPLDDGSPIDSRPGPFACHIQAKTVWAGNETISINLGTLEYIAKDARPAFLVVFEVDDKDLSFVATHLIHIEGAFLAEVLKRLRQARVDGKAPNKISFEPTVSKWATRLPSVSGAALRAAMESVMSVGMDRYAESKLCQLSELGYERGGIQLQTTLTAETREELINGFLGLSSLRVAELTHVDNRFGIPIALPIVPSPGHGFAAKLKPKKRGRCTIVAERRSDGAQLEMEGDLFVLAGELVGPERVIIEARTNLLRIRTDVRQHAGDIVFASIDGFAEIRATASEWVSYFRLGAWSIRDAVTIELKTKRNDGPPPLIGGCDPTPDLAEAEHYERMTELAEIVEWALTAAGAPGTKLTSEELLSASSDLATLRAMKLKPAEVPGFTFTSSRPPQASRNGTYDLLYVNTVPLGEWLIAFSAKTTATTSLEDEQTAWHTGALHLELVRKIKNDSGGWAKFVREAKRYSGIASVFGPGLSVEP